MAAVVDMDSSDDAEDEEPLVWDSGLSGFLSKLEGDLIQWQTQERARAKEWQAQHRLQRSGLKKVQAVVDGAAALDGAVTKADRATCAQKVEAMVRSASSQREELGQMLELIQDHVKSRLTGPDAVVFTAFAQQLPREGSAARSTISGHDVLRQIKLFIEAVERQPTKRKDRKRVDADGDRNAGKGKRRVEKPERRGRGERRGMRASAPLHEPEEEYSEYSDEYSRSPTRDELRSRRDRNGCRRREQRDPAPGNNSRRAARTAPPGAARSYPDGGCRDASNSRGSSRSRSNIRPRRCHGNGRDGRGEPRGSSGRGHGNDNILALIDRFVRVNRLNERGEKIMRELSPATARIVMGTDGKGHAFEMSDSVRDPTAVLMARIRNLRRGGDKGSGRGSPRRRRGGCCAGGRSMSRNSRRGGEKGGGRGSPRRQRGSRCAGGRSMSRSPSVGQSGVRGRGPPPGRARQQTGPDVNVVPLGRQRSFAQRS